jgi:hypothetical protein
MKKTVGLILILLGIISAGNTILAAEKEKVCDVSEEEVLNFIKVFPKLHEKLNVKSADPDSFLKAIQGNKDIANFAKECGYENENDMMRVFSGVLASYAFLKYEESEALLKESMATLPPALAAAMKPQLKTIEKTLQDQKKLISDKTIDAVKKHYSEIEIIIMGDGQADKLPIPPTVK